MPQPRDTQRQRVYDATFAMPNSDGRTIPNDRLQAWVDQVLEIGTIRRRWPEARVHVRLKRGGKAYGYEWHREITLPLFARNEWIILHEMAHVLNEAHHHERASHGPEFVRVFLYLVEQVMGREKAAAFKASLKQHRVRIAPASRVIPAPKANVRPARKPASQRTLDRLQAKVAATYAAKQAADAEYAKATKALRDYRSTRTTAVAAATR